MPSRLGSTGSRLGGDNSTGSSSSSLKQPGTAPLNMTPLPTLHTASNKGTLVEPADKLMDFGKATGNLEDAKLAIQELKLLLDDAVFLDEEAYGRAAEIAHFQHKIMAQQRRMREMELEISAVQAEVASKDQALAVAAARNRELSAQVAELQQELDNNSVVFKMHFQELLLRNEEVARLKALVEQRQPGRTQDVQGDAEDELLLAELQQGTLQPQQQPMVQQPQQRHSVQQPQQQQQQQQQHSSALAAPPSPARSSSGQALQPQVGTTGPGSPQHSQQPVEPHTQLQSSPQHSPFSNAALPVTQASHTAAPAVFDEFAGLEEHDLI